MCDVVDSRVSFMEAMEMFLLLRSWINSSLFPLIPLMFTCRKVVRVVMRRRRWIFVVLDGGGEGSEVGWGGERYHMVMWVCFLMLFSI